MNRQLPSFTALLLLLVCPAGAGELVLQDVSDAQRLIVTAWQADIELAASNDDNLRVSYSCVGDDEADAETAADGLRTVGGGTRLPELGRNDEKITLGIGKKAGACSVRVQAPAQLDVELRVNYKGEVFSKDRVGSVTTWVAEGDVTVTNHAGPFSVTAMSGNASVEFSGESLSADSAMTAANGLLTLSLQHSPPVTLRAQARWGDIRSDLDVAFANTTAGGKSWSAARLAGGGPTVTLRNLNRDIVIRGPQ